MSWLLLNLVPLLNMSGIALDIAGAYFVAYEVVRQFRGEKHEASIGSGPIEGIPTNDPPVETKAYRDFEQRRFSRMKTGLILLTIGFSLQFFANVLQLQCAPV